MINGVITPVYNQDWGYVGSSNAFSYQNGLLSAQKLLISENYEQDADYNPMQITLGRDQNERITSITVLPFFEPIPNANNIVLKIDSGSSVVYWNYIEGQDKTNTTVIAIGDNQVIKSYNISIQDSGQAQCSAFFNGSQDFQNTVYTIVVTVKVGMVYQGSGLMFAQLQGVNYPQSIIYTEDGLLATTTMTTVGNWNSGLPALVDQLTRDLDGNITTAYHLGFGGAGETQVTTNASFNVDGIPLNTTIVTAPYDWVRGYTTIYSNILRFFDTSVIAQINATRTQESPITSDRYYEQNNQLNAVTNIAPPDPNDQNAYTAFFNHSLVGPILSVMYARFTNSGSVMTLFPVIYFPDTQGNVIAQYGLIANSNNQTKTTLQLFSPIQPFNASDLLSQEPGSNLPDHRALSPQCYLHSTKLPYQQIMDKILSSLNPALRTPRPTPPPPQKHRESFLDELIEIVVAIVVMV
ncbi:MAG: hypothetical protein ACD_29C00264G0001, partial [uncultured bacterium]